MSSSVVRETVRSSPVARAVVGRVRRFFRPPRRAVPTRAGLFALAAPIVLGMAAVNAGNNLLFMLLGGVLGSIVLSGILSERNMRRVVVDVRPVSAAYAGEPARLQVTFSRDLEGADRAIDAYGLRVVERRTRSLWELLFHRRAPDLLEVMLPVLEGSTGAKLGERVFARRGEAKLGACDLTTRYPFGLLEKSRDLDVEVDVLVRPKRIAVPRELADPRGLAHDGDESERRGLGLELYGLREKDERDALHRTHALRSLSLGRDVVIETAGIERPIAWLGVANFEGADAEALERALELAQATLEEWDRRGYAVGLVTATSAYEPGTASLSAILDALARVAPEARLTSDPRVASLWIAPHGASRPHAGAVVARVDARGALDVERPVGVAA